MLAVFCLRLAAGMIACLLLLPSAVVNPRFFRTHFLTALALAGVAFVSMPRDRSRSRSASARRGDGPGVRRLAGLGTGGSARRTHDRVLTALALAAALGWLEAANSERPALAVVLLGDLTSAAVLGSALTAMLLGHSYLIAPTMSLTPLMRLLAALAVATLARLGADAYALGCWTSTHSLVSLNDAALWLPLRWLLGFLAPLGLDWMAWQTARIRSTQSATGILYVVVIFCFLGELTSQLLRKDGMTL